MGVMHIGPWAAMDDLYFSQAVALRLLNAEKAEHISSATGTDMTCRMRFNRSFSDLEDQMNARLFQEPVFISEASGLIREIASLWDAIDFLEDWPERERDLVHETALRACYDAYIDLKPLSTARHAIEGFARKKKILADPESVMPWIGQATDGGGRVPA